MEVLHASPPEVFGAPSLPFPVVGIGASAGALEAFSEFFEALPADSGMAFVLIQHLPPDKPSLMAEILSRKSRIPVHQVEDRMQVNANCAYVIRPGHTLTLEEGRLRLGHPVHEPGHRRPVDDFFRSLAAEQKERSIVLVMSGMGSNGTAGAQAIKAAGGLCVAQDPDSAEFPGMPRSLLNAGYADLVLRPREMPGALLEYARHPYFSADARAVDAEEHARNERHHLNEVLAILRMQSGRDFSGYRKPTLLRRIQRRMGLSQVTSMPDYVNLLRSRSEEMAALGNDLTISVTGFFRDAPAWEVLREQVLAPLIADRDSGRPIRAWVAGCATGEEAYTLAMLFSEEIARSRKSHDVKVFATDASERALAHARSGTYPTGIEGGITPERLERFFEKDDHSFRIRKEIREMVVFAPQNLLTDPPFSRLDLCSCRNLLIYLEPVMQRRVISLLHFSLRVGGSLFLGNSENVGSGEELFETISKKWRIYRRVGATRHAQVDFPITAGVGAEHPPERRESPVTPPPLSASIQRALMERFGPPLVVIDRRFRVVYFQGHTDRYLMNPTGEPTRNLFDMTRDSLRGTVRAAARKAVSENKSAQSEPVRVDGPRSTTIRVGVAPLGHAPIPEHFVVTFEAGNAAKTGARPGSASQAAQRAAPEPTRPADHRHAESELRSVRDELQSTIEELESSNEELKASNEEVTSINEELQSTNEELETSKEELQSLNEELVTVNSQLQAKVEELEATTNDLTNLLSSTDIAVVFLDTSLRIRRFTPAMRDLLELIPSDVGRPVAHLAHKFDGGDLTADAQAVLDRLVPIDKEIRSHSGRWYARRALPYRTNDNRIDGVVLTFIDITQRRQAEDRMREAQARLQAVLEQMPAAVLIAEAPSGRLVLGNQQAAVMFGHPFPLPFLDTEWATAYVAFKGFHRSGRPYQRDEWPLARALNEGKTIVDEEIRFVRPDGARGTMSASAAPVRSDGKVVAAVATFWDTSNRSQTEQALRESERRFRLLVEGATEYGIMMLDSEGTILTWNSGAQRLFGRTDSEAIGQNTATLYTKEDRAAGASERELRLAAESDAVPPDRWLTRKDGTRFWSSGILTPLRSETGALKGFLKIVRDTTELQETQVNLQEAMATAEASRDAAEAANRSKDEFIATVSHELRTPLTAILLWSRMLRGKLDTSIAEGGLATIERAAKAQQQLVDDLLDVSRMAAGKLKLSLQVTQLTNAIEAAVAAIHPAADARSVTLETRLSPDVGTVRADPDRIQQIVWNLLSNSVKFTPSGGRVTVETQRSEDEVYLVVRDTGIGIQPDFMPLLFNRFQQASPGTKREYGGLGLGLAISRQLAELHGGDLTAASDGEGQGATFTVRLPLPRLRGQEARGSTDGVGDLPSLEGRRVLLVEDEQVTREALDALLRSIGADVTAVGSAEAALASLPAHSFDMIVSDIAMPGTDGYEMIREIREGERRQGRAPVPALALSAFARIEDQRRATDAGFHAYLVKPVNAERLLSVMGAMLKLD